MPQTTRPIAKATSTTLVAGVTNVYNTARFSPVTVTTTAALAFSGFLETLNVQCDTIVGVTSLNVRICFDAAGNLPVAADVVGTLVAGLTLGTSSSVTYKLSGLCLSTSGIAPQQFYVFFSTNAGTLRVTSTSLTWSL